MDHPARPSATGRNDATVRYARDAQTSDRRIERTRRDVVAAFSDLVLERGYDAFSVRDVIDRANVGRSTFYEHFANKADVLRESMEFVLTPLADTLSTAGTPGRLERVLAHFNDAGRAATALLTGSTREPIVLLLAELVEARLRARIGAQPAPPGRLPVAMVARALAEAQLGLVGAWLTDASACDPGIVARALHASATASAAALLAMRER